MKDKFSKEQLQRLHGNPRNNDNENIHSMTCKKFSKATRAPTLKVARGIVASSAGHKNWGKGMYFYKICGKFGRIRNKHKLKFNRTQRKGISNWWRSRSVEVKIKRARKKKKFMERQRKRARNMQRQTYKKNIDKAKGACNTKTNTTKKTQKNTGPKSTGQKKTSPRKGRTFHKKYFCKICNEKFAYKKRATDHCASK